MGGHRGRDVELEQRAVRSGRGGADGSLGGEEGGEVQAGVWRQVSEEEVGHAAGNLVRAEGVTGARRGGGGGEEGGPNLSTGNESGLEADKLLTDSNRDLESEPPAETPYLYSSPPTKTHKLSTAIPHMNHTKKTCPVA